MLILFFIFEIPILRKIVRIFCSQKSKEGFLYDVPRQLSIPS